jgi:hypothetical protein
MERWKDGKMEGWKNGKLEIHQHSLCPTWPQTAESLVKAVRVDEILQHSSTPIL